MLVYQKAIAATVEAETVARRIGPGRRDLADQLRRASTSIPLNIAEGAGEFSPREKVRFYRMARRSACECFAILDVIDRVVPAAGNAEETRVQLDEVLALLHRLMASIERPTPYRGRPVNP